MQTDVTGHGLAAEVDNLRAVLRWAIVHREAEIAQRISVALFHFGGKFGRVDYSEGRIWLERALELGDADDASPAAGAVRASALDAAGWAAGFLGDYDRAEAYFAAGLALVQQLGDQAGTALAQRALGWVALRRGELAEAQTWAEQSLALCRAADDPAGLAWSLYDLGHLAFVRGEPAQAEPLLTESLALFRGQANEFGCQRALISLGHTARAQGQLARATACYQESFRVRRSTDADQAANALEGLAAAIGAQGQAERAAQLFGVGESWRELSGTPLPPVQRAGYERDVAAVRAQLNAASFAVAWAAGRKLTLEQAVAEALKIAA
jgi:tetratricopeptide (TPR) repeat protein